MIMKKILKQQLVFAVDDTKRNVLSLLFEFVELFIIGILLCNSITIICSSARALEMAANIPADKMLRMVDNSSGEEFERFINDNRNMEKIEIIDHLLDSSLVERIVVDNGMSCTLDDGNDPIDILRINSNAINLYNIEFEDAPIDIAIFDFECNRRRIPVWLGASFKKYYRIGDVIDDDSNCFVVKGFIKRNAYYIDPFQSKSAVYLDKCFIAPEKWEGDELIECSSRIFNTYLICENKNDISKNLGKKIEQILGFAKLSDVSFQIEKCRINITEEILTLGMLYSVVVMFVIIGLLSRLYLFVNTHKKEFAIHVLVGASNKDIIIRIAEKYFTMIVVSALFVKFFISDNVSWCIYVTIEIVVFTLIILKSTKLFLGSNSSAIIKEA